MLTQNTGTNRDQLEMITLEQLVPQNHLVRKVEASIDFSFIYPLLKDMYSAERGRPSIDPVVLIKMIFILYWILKEASDKKLISSKHVFIDFTHVKASANKRKFEKKVVRKETKAYQAGL